jgi:hypothetical protein
MGNCVYRDAMKILGHTCRAVAPASKGAALPEPVVSEAHQGVEVRGEAARQIEELLSRPRV